MIDYRDSHRRLHDGITIDVQDAKTPTPDGDRWVHVRVSSINGATLYSGQMPLVSALVEIPYQVDRAREFERDYNQQHQQTD